MMMRTERMAAIRKMDPNLPTAIAAIIASY